MSFRKLPPPSIHWLLAGLGPFQQMPRGTVRLLANPVQKIVQCSPAVLDVGPSTGVPGHDHGRPVGVAADHGRPLAVLTPADEDFPSVQIGCDLFQLIGRFDFQDEGPQSDVAASSVGLFPSARNTMT